MDPSDNGPRLSHAQIVQQSRLLVGLAREIVDRSRVLMARADESVARSREGRSRRQADRRA